MPSCSVQFKLISEVKTILSSHSALAKVIHTDITPRFDYYNAMYYGVIKETQASVYLEEENKIECKMK